MTPYIGELRRGVVASVSKSKRHLPVRNLNPPMNRKERRAWAKASLNRRGRPAAEYMEQRKTLEISLKDPDELRRIRNLPPEDDTNE